MIEMSIRTFTDKETKEHTDFRAFLKSIEIKYVDEYGKEKIINDDNVSEYFLIELFFNHKKNKE